MGVVVTLQTYDGAVVTRIPDPNGGTFDAAGDFDDLLEAPDILPTLGILDPYGDTFLGAVYRRSLIADVDIALPYCSGSAWRGLRRLRVVAEMCPTDPSLRIGRQFANPSRRSL